MAVRFYFQKKATLKNRTYYKRSIVALFKIEKTLLESIDYVFCDDEYLLGINRDFLKHDFLTDIITFNFSDNERDPIIAEVYISVDRVKDNAIRFNVPVADELTRVIFHGALHLCGYKDKSAADKKQMRSKEDSYLRMFHGEH